MRPGRSARPAARRGAAPWVAALVFAVLVHLAALAPGAAARAEHRIVVLGDSNIAGYGVDPDHAYPAQLERALRARGHAVVVINEGVSGDTCAGLLHRLDSDVPDGTHLVLFSIGQNDMKIGIPRDALDAPWRELVIRLQARGIATLNIGTGREFQGDAFERAEMHIETNPMMGWHLNAAGYAVVVARTLPAVEAALLRLQASRE